MCAYKQTMRLRLQLCACGDVIIALLLIHTYTMIGYMYNLHRGRINMDIVDYLSQN